MALFRNRQIEDTSSIINKNKSTSNTNSELNNKLAIQRTFANNMLYECNNMVNITDNIVETLQKISSQLQAQETHLGNTIDVSAEVSACSQEMTASVDESMSFIDDTLAKAIAGQSSLSNMTNSLDSIKDVSSKMNTAILDLSLKTDQITGVTDTIKKISQSTKMLSINAKLEAARAGQYGSSFAVVAQEINKLSISSNESADNINEIIEEISEMMASTLSIVSSGVEEIDSSAKTILHSGNAMSEIIRTINELKDVSTQINDVVRTQALQNQNMLEAIDSLVNVSSELNTSIVNLTSNANTQSTTLDNIQTRVRSVNKMLDSLDCVSTDKLTLRYPMEALDNFDPHLAMSTAHNVFFNPLNKGLVERPDGFNVVGAIAQSWSVENDNLTWHFKLRENMKFHNGESITSDDVIYSLSRLLSRETNSSERYLLSSIEGADDYYNGRTSHVSGLVKTGAFSLKIKLSRPHSKFINNLSHTNCSILCKDSINPISGVPYGCGPYTLSSIDNGVFTLERFEDYTLAMPVIDRLVIDTNNPNSRVSKFINNEFDFIPLTNASELSGVAEAGYSSNMYTLGGIRSISFNFKSNNPLIHNKDVRKALNYCIDRHELSTNIYNNLAAFTGKVFSNDILDNHNASEYYQDISKATSLMRSSGINRGSLKILIREDGPAAEIDYNTFKLLQNCFSSINVDVVAIEVPSSQYYKSQSIAKCDLFLFGWVDSSEDLILETLVDANSPANFTGYNNTDFINRINMLKTIKNPYQYKEDLRDLENAILEESPWIFLGSYHANMCKKNNIHGLKYDSVAGIDFTKVWLD